jgi:polysaccharide export outer membrane protein
MKNVFALLAMVLASVALASCGGRGGLPNLPPPAKTTYSLDAGDKVQVTVFGEPRLTGPYTVADNGQISMPLLGPVDARGQTIIQLQNAIASQLQQRQLVINPGVSVQVDQFRPFFVLGEVTRPGQYPYVEGMSVLTAAAIAGGFTFRADKSTVSVTRKIDGKTKEFRASRDSLIMPGDTINVFESYL